MLREQFCNLVGAEPLGYGTEVNDGARILFVNKSVGKDYTLVSHQGPKAVHLCIGGQLTAFESETPSVDQWCYGYVEGSVCCLGHAMCHRQYLGQICIQGVCLSTVYARNGAFGVEHGQGTIYTFEACHDGIVQVLGAGVCYVHYRAEDALGEFPCLCTRSFAIVGNGYVYCSHDEEYEEC